MVLERVPAYSLKCERLKMTADQKGPWGSYQGVLSTCVPLDVFLKDTFGSVI